MDRGHHEAADVTLPPGQRLIDGFPRFGGHLTRPAPAVPTHPVIEIRGVVTEPFDVPLTTLAKLPRRELTADFHCVAGWSARLSGAVAARSDVSPYAAMSGCVALLVLGDGHPGIHVAGVVLLPVTILAPAALLIASNLVGGPDADPDADPDA